MICQCVYGYTEMRKLSDLWVSDKVTFIAQFYFIVNTKYGIVIGSEVAAVADSSEE